MSFCNMIEYENKLWSYVWVNSAPGLDESVKENLMWNIIDMHYDKDDIRHINNQDYGARIVSKGTRSLGMFSGDYFFAEFETEKVKSKLSILLLIK